MDAVCKATLKCESYFLYKIEMRSNFNSATSITPTSELLKMPKPGKIKEDYGYPVGQQMLEAERSDLAGITKQYLDLSTVHGLR